MDLVVVIVHKPLFEKLVDENSCLGVEMGKIAFNGILVVCNVLVAFQRS